MTEEILQSAILRLQSRATERFAIIKDLYHRPATVETVELITQHAIALAQLESGMQALQQYAAALAKQTDNEAVSNAPKEEIVEEVEAEEYEDISGSIGHGELMERSPTYRKSVEDQRLKDNKGES